MNMIILNSKNILSLFCLLFFYTENAPLVVLKTMFATHQPYVVNHIPLPNRTTPLSENGTSTFLQFSCHTDGDTSID